MWQVLRVIVLALSALAFAISIGASVASAKGVRTELLGPPPVDPSPLTDDIIRPPAGWPPAGGLEPSLDQRDPCKKVKGPKVLVGTLNLNLASAEELVKLPGIGPSKAKRIVRWRTRHRRFRRILDLRQVKGFGRKSVTKLYRYLTLEGPSTLRLEVQGKVVR